MKKLVFLLFICCFVGQISAQSCKRDSSILMKDPSVIILPAFYDAVSQPDTTTPPACIGEFYDLSVTLRVPETFTYLGNTLPLDSVVLPANAVTGMPVGLNYTCDPTNCTFKKNTLGCIRISGVPAATNEIKTYSLGIKVKAFTPFFPGLGIDFSFPLTPTQAFFIRLRPSGKCTSSSDDLPSTISTLRTQPNPTNGLTIIQFDATSTENFLFEVFNAAGQSVHTQIFQAIEGENTLRWDASNYPAGLYYFKLGNQKGSAFRKVIKN